MSEPNPFRSPAPSSVPTAVGPLDGLNPVTAERVAITDRSHWTSLSIRTTPGRARPAGPRLGVAEVHGSTLVCGSRPDEWSVLGPDAAAVLAVATELVAGATPTTADRPHLIEVTHGRALVEVAGTAAVGVLEKLCSLDFADDLTPDGAVVSASVAKVDCDLVRHDGDRGPAYLVGTDRSFGRYLFGCLVDAGAEFGARSSDGR